MQLKFKSRGKKGPGKKKSAELYAEARKIVGGAFTITRIEREGNKYFVDLKGGTRNGLSLEQFEDRISR